MRLGLRPPQIALPYPTRPSRWFSSFPTLHSRLLAAFILVIGVTLLSAGSAAVLLVRAYQQRLAMERMGELAVAASVVGWQLERQDARPEEIGAVVASQLGTGPAAAVRILVLDGQNRVLAERMSPVANQEPVFVGRRVEWPAPELLHEVRGKFERGPSRTVMWFPDGAGPARNFIFVAANPPPSPARSPSPTSVSPSSGGFPGSAITSPGNGPGGPGGSGSNEPRTEPGERFLVSKPQFRIVLAVPGANLGTAWRELAPSLLIAGLVSLAASVAVALWLSRSITRPVGQITRAAEAIARGDLHQSIQVRGRDEVAQLAGAFNFMSTEVERSHRALREFVANASHELRTPLTSIQGFAQALLDNALPGREGAAEAGQIIHEEAERMRTLVEDLLYLSQVESRDVLSPREPVDVASLLREQLRRLRQVADERGLTLNVGHLTTPSVHGNADEIDHLLGNLLVNAGKYTPPGGVITITSEASHGAVKVRVHNTGTVIPADDLPQIFERFYRVDKSRARDLEGSGLGLAIAMEVAERHGGTIEATSSEREGTAFVVTLPCSEVPVAGGTGLRTTLATARSAGVAA